MINLKNVTRFNTQHLPYYGRNLFAGGSGSLEYLPFVDWRKVSTRGIYKGRLVAAEICGESLLEESILDGDLAVIELTHEARDGQLVAVLTPQGMMAKYFYRERNNTVRLESRNQAYAPLYFRPHQIRVHGIIREIIRKLT